MKWVRSLCLDDSRNKTGKAFLEPLVLVGKAVHRVSHAVVIYMGWLEKASE